MLIKRNEDSHWVSPKGTIIISHGIDIIGALGYVFTFILFLPFLSVLAL